MAWTLTAVLSVGAAALMSHLWGDYRAVERLNYAPDGPAAEWARYQQHGSTLLLPYEQLVISINLRVAPDMASSLLKMGLQAAQFYPVGSTVQRYALGLAYQGKTDEAVLQIRRLRDEYWYETDYVPQIGLLIQLCSRKNDTLAAFCTRLKSEKLLVEPGAETQTRPVQMSK